MSYDLYFWPTGAVRNPGRTAGRLAEGRPGRLAPDPRVLEFRAELVRRWPDVVNYLEPWHTDQPWPRPAGPADAAHRYVLLTLPYHWPATDALPVLAGAYGMDCYDPQCDQLTRPSPTGPGGADLDAIGHVAGRVDEDRLGWLLQRVGRCIGYAYDDLDEAALTGAFDDPGASFEYPLAGTPPLLVRLARPQPSAAIDVRLEGAMDLVLAARIEALIGSASGERMS
ncbi:hypothetical protein ACFO1B_33825 [Dactylosporangium siamense]|uniref:Uncharacterized protein n=1 Tax=Dactylosporangium siamense TaxID=685454 RepID=A0A919PHN8_9ACTN|nr:hypothetical protein [Dactylosporangium siamense]GIG42413.1 hypothetical protein Dsi01nite_004540 [Dactylosporangium siamense]